MVSKFILSGINGNVPLVSTGSLSLGSALARAGLLTETWDRDCKGLIVADFDLASRPKLRLAQEQGLTCVLLRSEPAVVCPLNYSDRILKQFDAVLDVGRIGFGANFESYWPQSWPSRKELQAFRGTAKLHKCVLINANKLSLIPGELYSLRRSATSKLEVDLFGRDWDSKLGRRFQIALAEFAICVMAGRKPSLGSMSLWFRRAPSFRGSVESKLALMAKYKVALVIENSADYMSEKLHDALFAGCIPVYVGPPVSDFGIPSDLVVQAHPSLEGVSRGIRQALEMDHSTHLEKLANYLDSENTRSDWTADSVFAKISDYISSLKAT